MGAGMVALSFSSGLCSASRGMGAAEPTFKMGRWKGGAGIFIPG